MMLAAPPLSPEKLACLQALCDDVEAVRPDRRTIADVTDALVGALSRSTDEDWRIAVQALDRVVADATSTCSLGAARRLAQFVAENADLLSA